MADNALDLETAAVTCGAVVTATLTGHLVMADVTPYATAAILTTLLAKPVSKLTIAELRMLQDAADSTSTSSDPAATLAHVFP